MVFCPLIDVGGAIFATGTQNRGNPATRTSIPRKASHADADLEERCHANVKPEERNTWSSITPPVQECQKQDISPQALGLTFNYEVRGSFCFFTARWCKPGLRLVRRQSAGNAFRARPSAVIAFRARPSAVIAFGAAAIGWKCVSCGGFGCNLLSCRLSARTKRKSDRRGAHEAKIRPERRARSANPTEARGAQGQETIGKAVETVGRKEWNHQPAGSEPVFAPVTRTLLHRTSERDLDVVIANKAVSSRSDVGHDSAGPATRRS